MQRKHRANNEIERPATEKCFFLSIVILFLSHFKFFLHFDCPTLLFYNNDFAIILAILISNSLYCLMTTCFIHHVSTFVEILFSSTLM